MKPKLPILTLADVRSWGPCYDPIKWAKKDSWRGTALDILKAKKIPAADRLWAVLRNEAGLDDKTLRLFARWCARDAACDAARAARDAACDAACDAARAAQIEHLISLLTPRMKP